MNNSSSSTRIIAAIVALFAVLVVPMVAFAQETIDLAIGGQDFTITSTQPGVELTQFSGALASGDLNGDGIGDLVVGAAGRDEPAFLPPIAGEAYVVFGPLSSGGIADLSTPADVSVKVIAADAGDHLGWSVALADVTGDGNDDLIVGAMRGDGPGNSRLDAGEVYVFFGPIVSGTVLDLSTTAADVTIYGVDAEDTLGFTIAASDVSGDGIADLILGAIGADGASNAFPDTAGEVHVLFGGAFTPGTVIDLGVTAADVTVFGGTPSDLLGFSVVAGDVSGDGIPDLIMGAAGALAVIRGQTHVLFGPLASGTAIDLSTTAVDVTISGVVNADRVGWVVDVGDITGDGIGDLITGARIAVNLDPASPAFGIRTGAAYAFFGPLASGLDVLASAADLTVYLLDNPLITDNISSVAVGDVTGDGTDDLIIGQNTGAGPLDDRQLAGEAFALFGPFVSGTLIDLNTTPADVTVFGKVAGGQLGRSVATGDVTGDGLDDLLLEASFVATTGGGRGEAYVIFGRNTPPLDSDGDGIIDADDACPETPPGEAVDLNGCSDSQVDSDGDGFCDPDAPSSGPSGCSGSDNCPNSDLRETIVIDGIDTGVENDLLDDGCTLSDLIDDVPAADPSTVEVIQFLVDLRAEGIITAQDLGAILKALNSP